MRIKQREESQTPTAFNSEIRAVKKIAHKQQKGNKTTISCLSVSQASNDIITKIIYETVKFREVYKKAAKKSPRYRKKSPRKKRRSNFDKKYYDLKG